MIYDFPHANATIRQGDIFAGLPRVDVPLRKIMVVGELDDVETDWDLIVHENQPITAMLPVRPVLGIVATQDCDAVRNADVTLCEIRDFADVEGMAKDAKNPKAWAGIITRQARKNLKWFYLPPDDRIGFKRKLGVDFTMTIRVPRADLEEMRHFRRGRLNDMADEHFRERLGEFFRRYPYDEWYPLNSEELAEYRKSCPDAKPFDWQK